MHHQRHREHLRSVDQVAKIGADQRLSAALEVQVWEALKDPLAQRGLALEDEMAWLDLEELTELQTMDLGAEEYFPYAGESHGVQDSSVPYPGWEVQGPAP